jgi:flagellar protein FliJ
MPPFVYRLQKVYEIRERKKKEQERRVAAARARITQIEQEIQAKKHEIRVLRNNMLTAPHVLMEAHDIYIHLLNEQLEQLYRDLELAKQQLEYELQLLVKAQAELEALVKHKEKAYEEYMEEEKAKELKLLDEIATQRYFRAQQEKAEEEAQEAGQYEEQMPL